MDSTTLSQATVQKLRELFTRLYQSTAAYILDAGAYTVAEDQALLALVQAARDEDRRHATQLAELLEARGVVPGAGAFPHWYRDLNYLTLPYLASFLRDTLQADVSRLGELLDLWPAEDGEGRGVLQTLRRDRHVRCDALKAPVEEARAREAQAYAGGRERVRAALGAKADAKAAAEKAAREAARKPAPKKAAAAPAQDAAKLSPKERARQAILEARKKAGGAAPAKAAPDVPDPNEEGISAKEKARRQILKMRAEKQGGGKQGGGKPAAADIPDPNEEGISAKEKARRQILKMRAERQGGGKQGDGKQTATPQETAATAPSPAADVPDPDEPGISAKEKARRQVLTMRAARQAETPKAETPKTETPKAETPKAETPKTDAPKAETPKRGAAPTEEAAPAADDLPDPDEPGISSKEKARRQVLRMRARQNKG